MLGGWDVKRGLWDVGAIGGLRDSNIAQVFFKQIITYSFLCNLVRRDGGWGWWWGWIWYILNLVLKCLPVVLRHLTDKGVWRQQKYTFLEPKLAICGICKHFVCKLLPIFCCFHPFCVQTTANFVLFLPISWDIWPLCAICSSRQQNAP